MVSLDYNLLKSWTIQDYQRLSDLGLIAPNERTELLAGQIFQMAAKGTAHVLALRLLTDKLADGLAAEPLFISTQDPIQLDEFSEPEPDLAIVKGTAIDYAENHPRPQDIELIVEIADSTLKQDCDIKAQLYAQANIQDYWVLDLKKRQLHIFRNPTSTGYGSQLILREPHQVSPLAFPNCSISLTDILPPIS